MYADNLIGITQNFLKPEIVNKFSRAVGETTEKTQRGLKTIIPALLMGIVNKAQSKSGAEVLVNLVNKDGLEGEKLPESSNDIYLDIGTDVVDGIFGNNLDSVVSKLGDDTGIQSSGIHKMLKMAAPLVMGFLGTKMKRENLSTAGLMGFLNQQKSTLTGLVPEGLVGRFTGSANTSNIDGLPNQKINVSTKKTASIGQNMTKNKRSPALIITLFALALFIGLWWFTGRRDLSNIVSTPDNTITATREAASEVIPLLESPIASTINELVPFLQSGSEELPRAFRFENLNFILGTNNLMVGSEIEIEKIAMALKDFPNATARIEGYTNNTRTEAENLELSSGRAVAVKAALEKQGIDPKRIEAIGMGSSKPISTNDTEEGRAQNQRIEFVVTRIQ